jgi:maltose alpha-D-glucosyltransferase/alpha-amylase
MFEEATLHVMQTRLKTIMQEAPSLTCIRIHGDYHLGQLLWTGDDFVVIDFEGEPGKSQELRRNKFPVHKDLAGMLRSFSYAALVALDSLNNEAPGIDKLLRPFANAWIRIVSDTFYERYLYVLKNSDLVYASEKDNKQLLDFFMMQKAIYEFDYEYHNRPQWTQIPMHGIQELMEHLST